MRAPVVAGTFGRRRVVHLRGIGAAGGQLVDARVGDRGDDHLVLGRQLRQHRHQPLVEREGVEVGQQHHQRPPPGAALHRGNHCGGVRFDQRGLQRRHRLDQLGAAVRCATRCRRRPG